MTTPRSSARTSLLAAFAGLFLVASLIPAATAAPDNPTAEGRPVSPVPAGPNVTQVAPADLIGGFVYEKLRIKRTVPLDPTGGLDGRWDPLYAVQDSTGGNASGLRTAYMDWDDDYLYLGLEMPAPEQARFDLDLGDDGWLHGADNLTLIVTPPAEGSADAPGLNAQRFDMAQNKDQPVWAASPIPTETILVKGGRTPRGTYAFTVAIPRTEVMGLERKEGHNFGLRVDAAAPTLPGNAGEVVSVPIRPMLRLSLADSVNATGPDGLTVTVNIDGKRDITPGGEVKATLEIKNNGTAIKRLSRVYLRGSQNDGDYLDEQKFAGIDVEPGKSVKRSFRSVVAPAAPIGSLVLRGGADIEGGPTLAALAAFDKVEPYVLVFDVEDKPVPAGGENGGDARRSAKIILRSRSNQRVTAQVKLLLPEGWRLESGNLQRDLAMTRDGDVTGTEYKFFIPHTAHLGPNTIGAIAEVGGRTYKATGIINLVP